MSSSCFGQIDMDKSEISRPIVTILNGSNYTLWSQRIKSFLIGRKLWRIITGDIVKPIREINESDTKYAERLEDWDSKNHQIITWFCNTSISSIHIQFADLDTAKDIWDFLANRYKTTGLAHYYQLLTTLNTLKQESGQSVNDFLAIVQPIWNQLTQAKISDDHLHLIQVLMALRPEYESVRAALLHRDPLPTLDTAVKEILFEETRLCLVKPHLSEVALAITQPRSTSSSVLCKNCRSSDHTFANCPTVECRYCHKHGHILENCPTRPSRPKGDWTKSKYSLKSGSSVVAAAASSNESSSPFVTVGDLEAILKQVIPSYSPSSTACHSSSFDTSQPFFTDSSLELFPFPTTDSSDELIVSDPSTTPASLESASSEDFVPPLRRSSRVLQDVPILVMVSMLAYFCFLEQLLVSELGPHALAISLPFACVLGLLASMIASTMGNSSFSSYGFAISVSQSYIWAYASFQFALVILFSHVFYSVLGVSPVFSILLSSFTGFGISISMNSLLIEYLRWRARRTLRSVQLNQSQQQNEARNIVGVEDGDDTRQQDLENQIQDPNPLQHGQNHS
ncbi:hypothetical protein ZIOFF_011564 [Zingiber officinale]|uniref:CCHC-type domain-containing protein n=1 Tax=Zingiber officinale TaxID=94328 RepID=A0A8J5LKV6_ZINOF|nr:hypothetical protein ZIOFF_011564 [Zingiber officinale]